MNVPCPAFLLFSFFVRITHVLSYTLTIFSGMHIAEQYLYNIHIFHQDL